MSPPSSPPAGTAGTAKSARRTALTPAEIDALAAQLPEWTVVDYHHLRRRYELKDFAAALALANRVGAIADECDHHPDLRVAWGVLEVSIWTHTVDGLTRADIDFAARCEAAARAFLSGNPPASA